MSDPQADLEGLEPTDEDLRRAYDRGGVKGFSFEEALADPAMRRLLEIDAELFRKRPHAAKGEKG